MKHWRAVALAGFATGLALLATAWVMWTGPGPLATSGAAAIRVRIPHGMTLSAAADTLKARGLLAHRRVLLLGARLTAQDRQLRAGLYELAYGQSPRTLVINLTTGQSVQIAVTIPEGLNHQEIAARVAAAFEFTPLRFVTAADSLAREAAAGRGLLGPGLRTYLDSLATSAASQDRNFHWSEGLLAPDTYYFAEGSRAETVARVLVATQLDRLARATDLAADGPNAALSPLELLTLASIVEAEARRDDERARIAAVYTNRLAARWRLEADPTVAFFLGKKGKRLFLKDLKVESPYNTYRRRGLPPAPIGTPGLASLSAAAQPDSACRAMYFVSDGQGGHVFSRTGREHAAAVARFRADRAHRHRKP